ncbi:hypothetical protein PLICRDRAFT_33850 [Plicaturopsis crispa FD-325 SS-3]|nr:hypothetical protein PLICRDRAFT_33850 [Plicaturopsis crispa FD-325 SS-3]
MRGDEARSPVCSIRPLRAIPLLILPYSLLTASCYMLTVYGSDIPLFALRRAMAIARPS